jgi:DNA mismatch endonuclease (patch repair protein)
MDKISTIERSRNMSAIRGKNTKPELLMRQWLFSRGYRYRLNVNSVPGHPDLFLRKYNTAIFVNGCFWHRHKDCKYAYTPKSNSEFWRRKFNDNVNRDNEVQQALKSRGIKQVVIWECTIKKMMKNVEYKNEILGRLADFFVGSSPYLEI